MQDDQLQEIQEDNRSRSDHSSQYAGNNEFQELEVQNNGLQIEVDEYQEGNTSPFNGSQNSYDQNADTMYDATNATSTHEIIKNVN